LPANARLHWRNHYVNEICIRVCCESGKPFLFSSLYSLLVCRVYLLQSFHMPSNSSFINIEIKARTNKQQQIRDILTARSAVFRGTDKQTDTYFNVLYGRLKLREGNIENNLIYYNRRNEAGPKQSEFTLMPVAEPKTLKVMLTESLGVKAVVKKSREIYFIENVKFHIDEVEGLGSFVEIEAGNNLKDVPVEELQRQCNRYLQLFEIKAEDLGDRSYSDLLLEGR
jgi:adenylate cyclase, class 2